MSDYEANKKTVVEQFKALSQETRLDIYRLLVQAGEEGLTPSDLQGWVDCQGPTLTFHLDKLAKSGLAKTWKEGRYVVYAANYNSMGGMIEFLTANCSELARIKANL